jgi:rubrerythrin
MELMELAKNMEIQGKSYYEKLAVETPIKELSGIFKFLAEEEQRHFELFDHVAKSNSVPAITETDIDEKVGEVFSGLVKNFSMPTVSYDYAGAYRKAFEMETESVKYYTSLKDKIDVSLYPFIDFIIKQEKGHANLMDALMDFTEKPSVWLENAEWNHIDLY